MKTIRLAVATCVALVAVPSPVEGQWLPLMEKIYELSGPSLNGVKVKVAFDRRFDREQATINAAKEFVAARGEPLAAAAIPEGGFDSVEDARSSLQAVLRSHGLSRSEALEAIWGHNQRLAERDIGSLFEGERLEQSPSGSNWSVVSVSLRYLWGDDHGIGVLGANVSWEPRLFRYDRFDLGFFVGVSGDWWSADADSGIDDFGSVSIPLHGFVDFYPFDWDSRVALQVSGGYTGFLLPEAALEPKYLGESRFESAPSMAFGLKLLFPPPFR